MRVTVLDSHCYPGCPIRTFEDADDSRALIEFSDGTVVFGDFARHDDEAILAVPPYSTARGSRIDAKAWRLRADVDPGSWRVKARVTAA